MLFEFWRRKNAKKGNKFFDFAQLSVEIRIRTSEGQGSPLSCRKHNFGQRSPVDWLASYSKHPVQIGGLS